MVLAAKSKISNVFPLHAVRNNPTSIYKLLALVYQFLRHVVIANELLKSETMQQPLANVETGEEAQ